MLVEILLGVFIIASIIEGYVIWNMMKKVERLEDWIETYTEKIYGAYSEMQLLDDRGVFEADDEVGDVFSQLKDVTQQLSQEGVEEDAS
jgi:hypothetical protein|tara:strand:- start:3140 stop:3406 length:267 start_codon:yes stop_codon:yes gene_type:complete